VQRAATAIAQSPIERRVSWAAGDVFSAVSPTHVYGSMYGCGARSVGVHPRPAKQQKYVISGRGGTRFAGFREW